MFGVKSECLRLGFYLKINEAPQDTTVLLSNPKSDRVMLVMFASNIFGDVLIRAYLVNRPKYEWALAEGFSLDQMIALVEEKVFIEVDSSKVATYLI